MAKAEAILVDIRPEDQRTIEGGILGTLVVERNVLEWRFDPASNARLPIATDHDLQLIVFCSEGYTSSLVAAALLDLRLWRAIIFDLFSVGRPNMWTLRVVFVSSFVLNLELSPDAIQLAPLLGCTAIFVK